MTEPQDVLAEALRETDSGALTESGAVTWIGHPEAVIATLAARGYALVRTPETLDAGTTTDCPLEGVHEHAFRGPHRFHEWDPSSYFTLNDRPPVRTPETLDVERSEAANEFRHADTDYYPVAATPSPTPPEGRIPALAASMAATAFSGAEDYLDTDPASPTPPEGLRTPYGGHPEFGPRVVANQAQPSIAGWESLAKDALLAFDQARAALRTPKPEGER